MFSKRTWVDNTGPAYSCRRHVAVVANYIHASVSFLDSPGLQPLHFQILRTKELEITLGNIRTLTTQSETIVPFYDKRNQTLPWW